MARWFNRNTSSSQGNLIVEKVRPNCTQVFYIPSNEKLTQAELDPNNASKYRVKLLLVDGQDDRMTLYPINTMAGHHDFLKQKYEQVERITLAGFALPVPDDSDSVIDLLEALPPRFIKDYDFGLGLQNEYRFVVDTVEEISGCTEIVIARGTSTGVDKRDSKIFIIAYADLDNARKSVNRITNRARVAARSVEKATVYNLLAARIGEKEKPVQLGKHPLSRLFAQAAQSDEYLGEADQQKVINVLSRNTKAIAETKPERLTKLQNDIELVTLQVLIERYETMLGQKLKEGRWQAFLNKNSFILSLAFGYPIIKVKDQASVGGRKLSGSGEKITDFLVKNSLTNNTALFEIKTPQAKLLNKTAYREGIFTPSLDLSGSINQALDQKYQFQKQIAQIKDASRIYNIESYAIHSCLIIGTTPTDVDQQKSFELYRRNSKDVQIVTFDELLEKLRQLLKFLASGDKDVASC